MKPSGTIARALLILLLAAGPARAAAAEPTERSPFERASLRLQLVYGDLAVVETRLSAATFQRSHNENGPSIHDPWLSFDKVQHFSFSLLITVGSQYALVNKLSIGERRALPLSMLTSASVGVAKEYYDRFYGPSQLFSRRDLMANAAGIIVAAGFILL